MKDDKLREIIAKKFKIIAKQEYFFGNDVDKLIQEIKQYAREKYGIENFGDDDAENM